MSLLRLCPIYISAEIVQEKVLCTLSALKNLYYFSSHDLGSPEMRSKCIQLLKVYRLNPRGVSELPAESVWSALMYCACKALIDSVSHDVGQIMCCLSQI